MRSAFDRLSESAARHGADGILGVGVVYRPLERDLFEFTATGTAVRGFAPGSEKRPVSCTLTAQEYTVLLAAGYRAVGVALGVSVYFQRFHQRVQQDVDKKVNTERSDFTRGIYTARRNAFTALHESASKQDAEGILAIKTTMERTLNREARTTQGMLMEMVVMGTAVAVCPALETQAQLVVPLNV